MRLRLMWSTTCLAGTAASSANQRRTRRTPRQWMDALAAKQETSAAGTFTYTLGHLNAAVAARGSRAVKRCEKFSTSMGRPNGADLCASSRGSGGVRPAASGAEAVAAARARGTADGIATQKAKSCIWHGAVKHAAAHLIIAAPRLLEAHCSSNNVRLQQQWESMWNGVCGADQQRVTLTSAFFSASSTRCCEVRGRSRAGAGDLSKEENVTRLRL
jgi:hypothetical protein